jgi:very-short-patch-repair endonuclease
MSPASGVSWHFNGDDGPIAERGQIPAHIRQESAAHGVVSRAQLHTQGVAGSAITRWLRADHWQDPPRPGWNPLLSTASTRDVRGGLLRASRSERDRGCPGSGAKRLTGPSEGSRHTSPGTRQTLSVLEDRFFELCERAGLPLPQVNASVGPMRVDALWPDRCVAVELDGGDAHGSWAQIKRDRQRELALRGTGLQVVRYTWEQITTRPDEVAADLWRLLRP